MTEKGERRRTIDPAVADILCDLEHNQHLARLPRAKRRKAKQDAQRYKITLDFPQALHAELQQIAEDEGVSVSGLVAFFTHRVVEAYNRGEINLHPYKRISRSARFEYILEIGEHEAHS